MIHNLIFIFSNEELQIVLFFFYYILNLLIILCVFFYHIICVHKRRMRMVQYKYVNVDKIRIEKMLIDNLAIHPPLIKIFLYFTITKKKLFLIGLFLLFSFLIQQTNIRHLQHIHNVSFGEF